MKNFNLVRFETPLNLNCLLLYSFCTVSQTPATRDSILDQPPPPFLSLNSPKLLVLPLIIHYHSHLWGVGNEPKSSTNFQIFSNHPVFFCFFSHHFNDRICEITGIDHLFTQKVTKDAMHHCAVNMLKKSTTELITEIHKQQIYRFGTGAYNKNVWTPGFSLCDTWLKLFKT